MRQWEAEDDSILVNNLGIISNDEIATILERSMAEVDARIRLLAKRDGLIYVHNHGDICTHCGRITYFGLDDEGWCRPCVIKAQIQAHEYQREAEELKEKRAQTERASERLQIDRLIQQRNNAASRVRNARNRARHRDNYDNDAQMHLW